MANNDCVLEAMSMEANSVDLIITSIPFANHYEYTPSYNDFGHTENNDHFWAQMDYLTPELLRVLPAACTAATLKTVSCSERDRRWRSDCQPVSRRRFSCEETRL